MDVFIFIALTFVSFTVGAYAFGRKMALRDRWFDSMRKGIRDWDRGAVLDAKATFGPELAWTLAFIFALLIGLLFALAAVSAMKGGA